jgi:haloalkane dehalogenase
MNRRSFIEVATMGIAGSLISQDSVAVARSFDAAWYERSRRYVKVPMGKVAYVEHGMGPAAVFLHGFPLNNFQWRGVLPDLSFERRCIAPDFLAMGHTETPEAQSVAPEAQVAMIFALLDQLGVPEFDLVASDSGGAVAQLIVARDPKRVRSLLLTNCDTEIDSPPPALLPVIEMSKAGTFVDQGLVPQLRDKAIVHAAQGLGGQCYSSTAHPTNEAIDYYLAPLASTPLRKAHTHAYAIALEKNPLEGIGPALRRYGGPVRVVWGMGDTIFSSKSPAHLDRAFPNSRGVRRLEGSKLFWPEERPDIVAEEARELWAM